MVWLLLGCVALAEQLNIVPETNSSDEQALTQLQLAVKSETLAASIGDPLPNLFALPNMVRPSTPVASVFSDLIPSFSLSTHTRSLPRFTCCYRI